MSYTTINMCVKDQAFIDRVSAAIAKEAWANPQYGDTEAGRTIKTQGPYGWVNYFLWPIAVDNETAYAYAINNDNPNPGGDPGVITDAAIGTGIQTHWPEPVVEPTAT